MNRLSPAAQIGMDVSRLMAVTADLLGHARSHPELLANDRNDITDCITQLSRMLNRLEPVKEAAE